MAVQIREDELVELNWFGFKHKNAKQITVQNKPKPRIN